MRGPRIIAIADRHEDIEAFELYRVCYSVSVRLEGDSSEVAVAEDKLALSCPEDDETAAGGAAGDIQARQRLAGDRLTGKEPEAAKTTASRGKGSA